MIILDTNIVSEVMRPGSNPAVLAWFDAQPAQRLCLSAIVVAELRFGIHSLPVGRKQQTLTEALDKLLATAFKGQVLAFDEGAAEIYGEFVATLRQRGVTVDKSDAMIAATARYHGATVATRNVRDFEPCGVRVVTPFAG